MKKVLFSILILLGVLTLSACATKRNQAPVITVENPTQVIQQGDDFDPLDGVTAEDEEDGDLTDQITVSGYETGDNDIIGTYAITLSVEDSGGLKATATIDLTVEGETNVEPPQLFGVVAEQLYYIGSGDYDPLAGVTAQAPDGTDITDTIEVSGAYLLDTAGTYTINIRVTYDGVRASRSILLTVVDSGIPSALTDNVTIEFWHAMGEDKANLIRGYADEFMDLYPNVTVVVPEGTGNYDTLKSNMINAITADDFPNMVQGYPDHVAEYLNGDAVLNLNPYIYSSAWGLNGDDALDDIIASYLEENTQYDANGTFYSLPFNKSTEVMIYNKTVFDKLGLDVPETWQDIIDIADELEAEGRAIARQKVLDANPGKTAVELSSEIAAAQALVVPAAYDSTGNAFITFARQFGGAYTSLNFSTFEGEFLWNSDDNTFAAMQFLKDNNDVFTLPEFWDQDYASTPFVNQQTFVTIGSSAGVTYNVPSSGFDIGVAPVPYNEDMPEEKAVIQQGTNISLMDTGSAQEKLASWLFLKYLISKEVTTDWAIETGYLPVRTSAYISDEYQAFLNNPSTTDKKAAAIANAANAAYQQSGHMFFDPAFIGSSRARTQVGLAIERIMLGDGNIQAALDDAYDEAKKGA
jgi:ABC-type glycerol-3-phosphate transport system substrate-binding protein